jgi:hypothetical protein
MFSGTAGKTITFKDGTSNLKMAGDFVMDNFDDTIMFVNAAARGWSFVAATMADRSAKPAI